jgi:triosephosphate isomerase
MSQHARRPIVAANWKMHFLRRDAESYCRSLRSGLGEAPADVLVFPSFPLLVTVAQALAGSPVAWGGQDLHPAAQGAHTGDVSGAQLADVGCAWALVGHSERRRDHGESDELVGAKARAAREHGLVPLICVGETLDERHAGKTSEVLSRQLHAALAGSPSDFELAYEPVWAIGSGETATPEIAQEAHAHLRRELARHLGKERSAAVRILYGGSVKPDNAAELIAGEDVDGFLVGGASLDSGKFLAIIGACA